MGFLMTKGNPCILPVEVTLWIICRVTNCYAAQTLRKPTAEPKLGATWFSWNLLFLVHHSFTIHKHCLHVEDIDIKDMQNLATAQGKFSYVWKTALRSYKKEKIKIVKGTQVFMQTCYLYDEIFFATYLSNTFFLCDQVIYLHMPRTFTSGYSQW